MLTAAAVIGTACVLAAYFAACHNALKTLSRRRLADLMDPRGMGGKVDQLMKRRSRLMLATGMMRAAFSLVVPLATLYVVEDRHVEPVALRLGLAFLVSIVLMSAFTVALPVYWARYRKEKLVVWSLPVLNAVALLLAPITAALHVFDPIVRRISGVDLEDDGDQISDHVLDAVESHGESGTVDESQREMLEAVLYLAETTAGQIMTPRTDVRGLEVTSDLSAVKDGVLTFGHSRIPVYREDMDHIEGILYAKDLIRFLEDGDGFDLGAVLREPFRVPETKPVRDLLNDFKRRKLHLAIVLDEYGGTAGIVTLEDILEEIVGEIQDEYEPEPETSGIEMLTERSAVVEARTRIDDLNDALDLELPDDEDYDTLGGFVVSQLGCIPEVGATFEAHGVRIVVQEAEKTKVLLVQVDKLEATASA